MSDMKAYLAEKYMSGPKADAILSRLGPQKKKKRKANEISNTQASGSLVVDNDGGWGDEANAVVGNASVPNAGDEDVQGERLPEDSLRRLSVCKESPGR